MAIAQLAAYPRLASIGVAVTSETPVRLLDRFDRHEGRLSNLAYMAAAIDHADGVGPAAGLDGRRQIRHLLSDERLRPTGLMYVTLRRLERAGDLTRLRAGLALLSCLDDREIDGESAAALMSGAVFPAPDDAAVAALTGQGLRPR